MKPQIERANPQEPVSMHDIRNCIGAIKLGLYLAEKQSNPDLKPRLQKIEAQLSELNDMLYQLNLSCCGGDD